MKRYAELLAGGVASAVIAIFVALAAAGYVWQGCN